MNRMLYTFVIIILTFLISTLSFHSPLLLRNSIITSYRGKIFNPLYNNPSNKENETKIKGDIKTTETNSGFLKYSCDSCSYIFDEQIGFKKRYPPGNLILLLLKSLFQYNNVLYYNNYYI